jgi:hypothetical protein
MLRDEGYAWPWDAPDFLMQMGMRTAYLPAIGCPRGSGPMETDGKEVVWYRTHAFCGSGIVLWGLEKHTIHLACD